MTLSWLSRSYRSKLHTPYSGIYNDLFAVPFSEAEESHAVAQWLKHYATSQKVAGSRTDEVNKFFDRLCGLIASVV
jgi:hypothetical protein